jgi:hypothetical protein
MRPHEESSMQVYRFGSLQISLATGYLWDHAFQVYLLAHPEFPPVAHSAFTGVSSLHLFLCILSSLERMHLPVLILKGIGVNGG